jgi:hypothetical protein
MGRRSGGTGGINEGIPFETNLFLSPFPNDGFDTLPVLFHFIHPGSEMNLYSFFKEEGFDPGLHGGYIVERGMVVPGKIDVPMEAILIGELEELPPGHGNHLFRSGEATVVAHDPSHQTRAQEHVRSLQ